MAQLFCNLEEFHNIVGPKVRNDVATVTKKKKNQLGLICQHCNTKADEFDAAHKHASSRKDIIETILDDYESEDGKYIIPNLQKMLDKIKEQHKSDDVFVFLCKDCHRKYDAKEEQRSDNVQKTEPHNSHHMQDSKDYEKEFEQLLSQNASLKECLREFFSRFPDTEIQSTKLRNVYRKHYPNKTYKQTQSVTNYLWHLAQEGFLKSTGRSYYKLADKTNR